MESTSSSGGEEATVSPKIESCNLSACLGSDETMAQLK